MAAFDSRRMRFTSQPRLTPVGTINRRKSRTKWGKSREDRSYPEGRGRDKEGRRERKRVGERDGESERENERERRKG